MRKRRLTYAYTYFFISKQRGCMSIRSPIFYITYMSKHKFQLGNKLGGNKPKQYKTKQIRRHVPEDIYNTILEAINANVKEYLKTLKKD